LILTGKTILITRSKNASSEIQEKLESLGASVVCLPTIEITAPDSWDECDASIWKLAEYDSVCFTSKNTVEKFIQRIRLIRPQALNTLAARNLFAVGEKTKLTLETCGFTVQPIPHIHSAENLAHSFYGQNISGRHFLFPKSNIACNILPNELRSLGAVVDEIITYKTVIPESENIEHIRFLLTDGKINIVTFFSPSSVRNFMEMAGVDVLRHMIIAVIGPTTAEVVKEAGLIVDIVAKQQTAESLVREIADHVALSR
jgi:uroporphyrinogen III methyltransferase / synthase